VNFPLSVVRRENEDETLQLLLLLLVSSDALTTCYYPVMYCCSSVYAGNAKHPGLSDVLPAASTIAAYSFTCAAATVAYIQGRINVLAKD